jgi:hypothetical protein
MRSATVTGAAFSAAVTGFAGLQWLGGTYGVSPEE